MKFREGKTDDRLGMITGNVLRVADKCDERALADFARRLEGLITQREVAGHIEQVVSHKARHRGRNNGLTNLERWFGGETR